MQITFLSMGLTLVRSVSIFLIAATLCLIFPMAIKSSAHADHPGNKALRILFINPGFEDQGFWKQVTDSMRAASHAFGYSLSVVYGDRKWPLMVARGEDAIHSIRPDYLILVNENQKAPSLLRLAQAYNIPTLFLLNDLTDRQKQELATTKNEIKNWIGSIVPDNRSAGLDMARSLVEKAKERKLGERGGLRLLTLAGDSDTPASLHRVAGVDDMLAESPYVQEVRRLYVDWSQEKAYKRTALFLREHLPDMIWAANDPIAFGAMTAIEEAGLVPGEDVILCGLNWSKEAIEQVIDNRMTMTHGGHFLAGAWSIVMLEDFRRQGHFGDHGQIVRFRMAPLQGINAVRYKKKFSDGDWSKIDFRSFLLSAKRDQKEYDFAIEKILGP